MKTILVEGFDYHDLVGQMDPVVQVDEYAAKMGEDDEIVTVSFTVKGRQVGEDLVDWFERGYEFILDSQVSDGEVTPGKYLVFVEMDRRSTVPERICKMIKDLETLTDISPEDWVIEINDEEYEVDEEQLKSVIILSPHDYRKSKEKEEGLNEMRSLSGITPKKVFGEPDSALKDFLAKAGL